LVAKLTTVNFSQLSGRENIPVHFHPLHGKNPVLPICQTNTPRVEANEPKEGNPETDLGKNYRNPEKKRKKKVSRNLKMLPRKPQKRKKDVKPVYCRRKVKR
jgi:hypothetical protein